MAGWLTASPTTASAQIDLEVLLPDGDGFIEANADDVSRFFNRAKCECDTEFGVEFFIPDLDAVPDSRPIEVWLGNDCADEELQPDRCGDDPFTTFGDRDALRNQVDLPISVRALADPIDGECAEEEVERSVYALVDETGDGSYEINNSLPVFIDLNPPPALDDSSASGAEGGFVIEWDLPDSRQDDFEFYQVLCANPDGTPVLDSPSDDPEYETPTTVCGLAPVDENGDEVTGIEALDPDYICGSAVFPANQLRVSDLPDTTEGYRLLFVAVDPSRNPTPVDFGVITPVPVQDFWEEYKDRGGLAEGGYCFVATATYGDYDHPHVVVLRDFRDQVLANSAAGRWFIRTYYSLSPSVANVIASSTPLGRALRFVTRVLLAPIVVTSGLWVYSGSLGKLGLLTVLALCGVLLVRRRRRRKSAGLLQLELEPLNRTTSAPRPRLRTPGRGRVAIAMAAAIGFCVLVATASDAAAQQEYLDELTEDEPPPEFGGPGLARWNFELRFGPFFPNIDGGAFGDGNAQIDGEGPFERMFGQGPMLMTKIALDRFFLYPEGQLGVTFGLGFLTTGADAYAYQTDADGQIIRDADGRPMIETTPTGKPVRVEGERTNLRLFPVTVGGVYRYTGLDHRLNIPLVPYAKLALAYTLWSVSRPSGAAAEVPTADCPDLSNDCRGDRGRGGSLGYDATLGLAVRAERIDADAGVSLRNELGVEHAGFFVELGYSKVDGFGSDTKLSVGDFTYFGGINFEF